MSASFACVSLLLFKREIVIQYSRQTRFQSCGFLCSNHVLKYALKSRKIGNFFEATQRYYTHILVANFLMSQRVSITDE